MAGRDVLDALFQSYLSHQPSESHYPLESKQCWHVSRDAKGLRLSDLGYELATIGLQLPHWSYPLPKDFLRPRRLLALDRYMTCAYYLQRTRDKSNLILFGSAEAMMLSLHGDAAEYLESLIRQTNT